MRVLFVCDGEIDAMTIADAFRGRDFKCDYVVPHGTEAYRNLLERYALVLHVRDVEKPKAVRAA